MTIISSKTLTNRVATISTAIVLSVLISSCGSGGSSGTTDPVNPFENNNANNTITSNTLFNVARSDAWVCSLEAGFDKYGAYSFFTDSTGLYEFLESEDDDSLSITSDLPFTYTFTSENSVQILYEYQDGTSLEENVSRITYSGSDEFTALSDVEGVMDCNREAFRAGVADASSAMYTLRF